MKDSFSEWLNHQIIESIDLEKLEQNGFAYIDHIETPEYSMYLLQNSLFPKEYKYHIAFQRFDTSALDYEQQMDLNKKERKKIELHKQYLNMIVMINKLIEWIKKYKTICIASSQDSKTTKWINVINYLSQGTIKIKENSFQNHRIVSLSL